MSKQAFFIVVPDLAKARGQVPTLSYTGGSAEGFATELQAALREPGLWERWRSMQPDPDAVDPLLGASDAQAVVEAHQSDLHCDVKIVTSLPHAVIKHRLGLLIGAHWTLRDVSAA
ncbi:MULTISPECIES: hypothetical protein [unclassified Rudaea]|uniref:hypothetical protein n=1 Tax=unclassified Rudaea TaxID=2627037 RepID=UPI00201679E3|nr:MULTISPECIES: hypothetical protein [unclassified Rudaea]